MNGTCYICDDVGLVGHCKVFAGGYLGHYEGSGGGGEEKRERRGGTFKKKQVTDSEHFSPPRHQTNNELSWTATQPPTRP